MYINVRGQCMGFVFVCFLAFYCTHLVVHLHLVGLLFFIDIGHHLHMEKLKQHLVCHSGPAHG